MKYDPAYQRTDRGEVLCEPVSGWVCHDPDAECAVAEPHFMDACGKFLPPRYLVRKEKRDRTPRFMRYSRFLEHLLMGKSVFAMLKDPWYSFTSSDTY